jgi:hypothetical protein
MSIYYTKRINRFPQYQDRRLFKYTGPENGNGTVMGRYSEPKLDKFKTFSFKHNSGLG